MRRYGFVDFSRLVGGEADLLLSLINYTINTIIIVNTLPVTMHPSAPCSPTKFPVPSKYVADIDSQEATDFS